MDDAHSPGGVNTRLACILSRTSLSFPAVPFHSLLNGSNQSISIPGPFLRGKAGPIRRSGDSGGLTIPCHRDTFSLPPRISWHCIRMYMSSSLALSFIYDVIRRLHVLVVRCRNASHKVGCNQSTHPFPKRKTKETGRKILENGKPIL